MAGQTAVQRLHHRAKLSDFYLHDVLQPRAQAIRDHAVHISVPLYHRSPRLQAAAHEKCLRLGLWQQIQARPEQDRDVLLVHVDVLPE